MAELTLIAPNNNAVLVSHRKLKGIIGPKPPDGYLNILMLGDGYPRSKFRKFVKDRAEIVSKFYSVTPFNALLKGINIFSRFEPSNHEGIPVGTSEDTKFKLRRKSTDERTMTLDEQILFDYVASLSFNNPDLGISINGGETWLTPGNKSFGMICVFGRCSLYSGSKNGPEDVSRDTSCPGGKIAYSCVGQPKRKELGYVAIHEIGHLFGLADEYEDDESNKIDASGICQNPEKLYYPGGSPDPAMSNPSYEVSPIQPNVVRRWELFPEDQRDSDNIRECLEPDTLSEPPPEFKWRPLMSPDDIEQFGNRIYPHPSWTDPDFNECKSNSVSYIGLGTWGEVIPCEGANHYRRGIYRSTHTCIMRTVKPWEDPDGYPVEPQFCKICYWTIRNKIDPTDHFQLGKGPWTDESEDSSGDGP